MMTKYLFHILKIIPDQQLPTENMPEFNPGGMALWRLCIRPVATQISSGTFLTSQILKMCRSIDYLMTVDCPSVQVSAGF